MGSKELCDGQTIPLEASAGSVITVTRTACAVRPAEYAAYLTRYNDDLALYPNGRMGKKKAFVRVDTIDFPASTGISINMMPFVIGYKTTLPEEYRQYWPMIVACKGLRQEEGHIGYLTIHESTVSAGSSQRRPGLHVETPGVIMTNGGETAMSVLAHWGGGDTGDGYQLLGGIYMASNVSKTTKVWNVQVKEPHLMVGDLGDIEHLRDELDEGTILDAGELIWFTDTTPHESLEVLADMHRQYFRLVTSKVSVWYDSHSTKNPLGIVPDPKRT